MKHSTEEESRPDYEFYGGITEPHRFWKILHVVNDYVLLSLLALGIGDLYWSPEGYETIVIAVLIVLWGYLRYIRCPEDHQKPPKRKR